MTQINLGTEALNLIHHDAFLINTRRNLFRVEQSTEGSLGGRFIQLPGHLLPINFILQHSTMLSVLPLDILIQIIDIIGENKDTDLLKELALVSHPFLQICSKHLFATVELHDAANDWTGHVASSKKGFIKLLKSRPDVVKHIRKLTYTVSYNYQSLPTYPSFVTSFVNDDRLLSPILPNFLRTISHLNCLTITASKLKWETLDSSLTSAFLHLMHLPTINHIELSSIQDFPLSSLTPSVNLRRLDIFYLICDDTLEEDGSPEFVFQSEMMPKLREFHTSDSAVLTTKLLHAKRHDGRPAFNFMDLRRLSLSSSGLEDDRNIRYLLQNARLLEKLCLSVEPGQSLVGLHDILSLSAHTLKVFDLTVSLYSVPSPAGLCEELEAMAGHNMLEALSFEFGVGGRETEDFIGSIIQKVWEVLIKPGWSALRQVSFKVTIACCLVSREDSAELSEALQSLPDKYLSHLSKLELNYSAYVVKCAYDRD